METEAKAGQPGWAHATNRQTRRNREQAQNAESLTTHKFLVPNETGLACPSRSVAISPRRCSVTRQLPVPNGTGKSGKQDEQENYKRS
jgi:hypothetical protein